ncbi:MAG: pilus assembly protein [Anaerolineales bacterium]|nr:pilus assembly protein [Anaerolineales bacterium]
MWKRMGAEAGQDLVEYALVLPLFLLLSMSIFEFGILYFQYSTVSNAAREAARAGIIPSTAACDDNCVCDRVEAAARSLTVGLVQDNLDVTCEFLSAGVAVRVNVEYHTEFISRMLIDAVGGNGEVNLQSTATMQREN